MRARPTPKQERRMPKRGASHRRNTISASKQSSPDRYSSHSQSPASSSSNGVDLACTSQQKKSLPEMGKRPPAKSKEMNGHHSATNTKLKLEHIDAITHVRESNIESIGPIAEVSLKNGGNQAGSDRHHQGHRPKSSLRMLWKDARIWRWPVRELAAKDGDYQQDWRRELDEKVTSILLPIIRDLIKTNCLPCKSKSKADTLRFLEFYNNGK